MYVCIVLSHVVLHTFPLHVYITFVFFFFFCSHYCHCIIYLTVMYLISKFKTNVLLNYF